MNSSYLLKSVASCAAAFANESENPDNWQAPCRDLGNLLQGMGRFDEAITWHSLALDSQPNLAEIYAQLGRLYAQEENWDDAIAFFKNALKSLPNSVAIYSNLAQIYAQLGKQDLETDCWYKAVQLDPEFINGKGYYKLGKAMEDRGRLDEAIDCYQKSCDREATLLSVHYKLAEMRLRQGDLVAAKACFAHIIQQDFDQSDAHYQLGRILSSQGEFDSAIAEFRQTIKIDPEFNWAYSGIVDAFMKQEKWDEAIATCHSIMNLVKEFPWAYSLLGNSLRAKGKIAEAVSAYQKSYSLRGWNECLTHDYFVPADHFTHRLALFETHLLPLANQENFAALEVGNYFGISACWLLDKVLTHPSASLTCVDRRVHPQLAENLDKTGAREKVTLLEKDVPEKLAALEPESFDLINLQDRKKQWDSVQQNATLVWKLVKVGGIIIFGDYGWRNPNDPEKNPRKGIDLFLQSTKGQWEVVAHAPRGFQLIIRKIANSEEESPANSN